MKVAVFLIMFTAVTVTIPGLILSSKISHWEEKTLDRQEKEE